jgi:hypothetical protein
MEILVEHFNPDDSPAMGAILIKAQCRIHHSVLLYRLLFIPYLNTVHHEKQTRLFFCALDRAGKQSCWRVCFQGNSSKNPSQLRWDFPGIKIIWSKF